MKTPRSIWFASALAAIGLGLTFLIQVWFTPLLMTLFFGVAVPACAAALILFGWSVYRDAVRPAISGESSRTEST
jgi:hypothetical protein